MTRRKSVCTKWTLVLVVLVLCPLVYSRPQVTENSETKSEHVEKTSEFPIRYRHKNVTLSDSFKDLLDLNSTVAINNLKLIINNSTLPLALQSDAYNVIKNNFTTSRESRLITHNRKNNNKNRNKITSPKPLLSINRPSHTERKPTIKKVVTKWMDSTKYDDFHLTDSTKSENDEVNVANLGSTEYYNGMEDTLDTSMENTKKITRPKPMQELLNQIKNRIHKRPKPGYHHVTDGQIHYSNPYSGDSLSYSNPTSTYTYVTPSPTPVITNLGNPQPWHRPNNRPFYHATTKKPTNNPNSIYNYQNSVHNSYPIYPGQEYEVTTFEPTNAYTDRIIIRPEDYSGSPDECPTIFLTLNNTFQGQGKEACPDLNIAVNTNVINKNVVIESDEEEDGVFSDPFGLPFEEESIEENNSSNEGTDYDENQEETESASIEGLSYTNFDASPNVASSELASPGYSNSPLQATSLANDDDDDSLSLNSFVNFFKPAISAVGWLTTLNPFGFGLLPLFLAPLVFLFAGTSGIAALFAPWAFSGREAPKIVQIHRPHWHWDDEIKTWHLHSFPHNRNVLGKVLSRSNEQSENQSSIKPTFTYRLKEFMKFATRMLRLQNEQSNNSTMQARRKRKKRETWTVRIK